MVPRPPSVDALATALDDGSVPRPILVEVARHSIASGRDGTADPEDLARRELAAIRRQRPLRVINATGVLLHTNLGRAPLAEPAAAAAQAAATGASSLEFDLNTGHRGGRGAYAARLIAAATGAEAGLAVNNTAGALLLTLAAIAGDGEAIVGRGELIEIGGSFRLPDLMAASGARMVEVGTTNRTRPSDYASAVGPATSMILKVHPSNYRVEGFTEEAGYEALAGVAGEHSIPFVADLGSGLLDARTPWLEGPPPAWLAGEPAARQTLEAGADLVMFSGDKLLGGPQAGIVAGSADLIRRVASHPVARAVRIDGSSLAALTVTLELYASGRADEIPFWRMATLDSAGLEARSRSVVTAAGVTAQVADGVSTPGAGSVPGKGIPGPVIVVPDRADAWMALVQMGLPVVARRDGDALVLDLRAVDAADDEAVAAALADACRS